MVEFFRKHKSYFILFLILILAVFAYFFTSGGGTQDPLLTKETRSEIDGSILGNEIIAQLADIRGISLGQDLFSNPKFLSLVSFIKNLKEEQSGRNNPFAPIGSGGVYIPRNKDVTPAFLEDDPINQPAPAGEDELGDIEDELGEIEAELGDIEGEFDL